VGVVLVAMLTMQREREAAERRRELDEKAAAEVKAERAVGLMVVL
jgi:hypothetical protein